MMRPDETPGFWNEYAPPKNAVAALAQRPLDQIDGHALCNAYMKDFRAARHRPRHQENDHASE
jgi:hypothetical protein